MRTGDGVFGPEDSGEDVVRRRHLAGSGHEAERQARTRRPVEPAKHALGADTVRCESDGSPGGCGRIPSQTFSPTSPSRRRPHRFISPRVRAVVSLRGHPIKLERYRED